MLGCRLRKGNTLLILDVLRIPLDQDNPYLSFSFSPPPPPQPPFRFKAIMCLLFPLWELRLSLPDDESRCPTRQELTFFVTELGIANIVKFALRICFIYSFIPLFLLTHALFLSFEFYILNNPVKFISSFIRLFIYIFIYLFLKCHYDENRIFSTKAIFKHRQVVRMRRKMPFTIFKYLFLFQRY